MFRFSASVPFTTALLAEYSKHDGQRTATIVSLCRFFGTAIVYNLLRRYASRWGNLLDPEADPAAIATINRRFDVGPPAYADFFAIALRYAPPSSVRI